MGSELQIHRSGEIGVIETDGYINTDDGEKILTVCRELLQEGIRHLIINLEKSNLVNSMGIICLLEAADTALDAEGSMSFCCATPTIAKTLNIMGVLKIARIFPSEQEAKEALERDE